MACNIYLAKKGARCSDGCDRLIGPFGCYHDLKDGRAMPKLGKRGFSKNVSSAKEFMFTHSKNNGYKYIGAQNGTIDPEYWVGNSWSDATDQGKTTCGEIGHASKSQLYYNPR